MPSFLPTLCCVSIYSLVNALIIVQISVELPRGYVFQKLLQLVVVILLFLSPGYQVLVMLTVPYIS